jgi:hypothetical protein
MKQTKQMDNNIIERLERIETKLDKVIAALHEYDDDQLHCEYSGLPSVKAYDEPLQGPCSKHDAEQWNEERMDIIGQNGNEGIHYVSNEEADDDARSNNPAKHTGVNKKRNKRYYKPKAK